MPTTKIICTLGPTTDKKNILKKMMDLGMSVGRLNFSHGTHADHLKRIKMIKDFNRKYGKSVKILGDMEGPRIRIESLRNGKPISVKRGQVLWLTNEKIVGNRNEIPFDYTENLTQFPKGKMIFIDDGHIVLKIIASQQTRIKTQVTVPGVIKEHKGVNVPDVPLRFPLLSLKDKAGIDFCVKNGVDFIAQSFVNTKEDILIVRDHLNKHPHKYANKIKLISKIETRLGFENIDEIITASDGIMVARGDMGISLPIYEVPLIQKAIIKKCNQKNKFVITATQMLESMINSPIPTRAEVSDVANAILDGSDYVMLSGETAAGSYPLECVDMMTKIIAFTEKNKKNLSL